MKMLKFCFVFLYFVHWRFFHKEYLKKKGLSKASIISGFHHKSIKEIGFKAFSGCRTIWKNHPQIVAITVLGLFASPMCTISFMAKTLTNDDHSNKLLPLSSNVSGIHTYYYCSIKTKNYDSIHFLNDLKKLIMHCDLVWQWHAWQNGNIQPKNGNLTKTILNFKLLQMMHYQ